MIARNNQSAVMKLILPALLATVLASRGRTAAFAPPSFRAEISPRCNSPASSALRAEESSAPALAIEDETTAPSDTFEGYVPNSSPLAIKETAGGDGDPAEKGDVLTVYFDGRVLSTGVRFQENEEFVFKMGAGDVMPGFDKGLRGAREGSKRTLRIPPKLAYGKNGKRGSIPPNADLEIDIEVKKVTKGPMGEIVLFGEKRAAQLVICCFLLAFAPQLEAAVRGVLPL